LRFGIYFIFWILFIGISGLSRLGVIHKKDGAITDKEKYKQLCLHLQFGGIRAIIYTHTLGAIEQ